MSETDTETKQQVLARITAQPEFLLKLWALAEPAYQDRLAKGWVVRLRDNTLQIRALDGSTTPRKADLVATVHRAADPEGHPKFVIVVDCPTGHDPDKFFSWPEDLAAARFIYRAAGRVLVISRDPSLQAWAREAFTMEPELLPLMLDGAQLDQALAESSG